MQLIALENEIYVRLNFRDLFTKNIFNLPDKVGKTT